jgi:uncharacterized Zn finger protein (UPF0148 family)
MSDTCRNCGSPLTRPATGRPPSYCGVPCRRSAELAIKRQDRRIERLMVRVEALQMEIPQIDHTYRNYAIDEPGKPPYQARQRFAHLQQLIAEAETTMRDLMGDTE